ncbi:MAG: regulatory protein GemA [Desulfuromonadales bacterium]|nr:regulatory protein GemA [Desulfuromonadales bacterium]
MRTSPTEAPITKQQIKMIHTLKSAMKMAEETYRGALWEAFGVDSSKDLTISQAESVVRYFEAEAIKQGVWEQRSRERNHDALKNRPGYATPAQLSYIEGLWKIVSRADDANERERRLRTFLMRQAKVHDLRFLKTADASKVICALQEMQKQK